MRNVVDFKKWKKARQSTLNNPRRAQPLPRGMVSIGVVSEEVLRRIMERD